MPLVRARRSIERLARRRHGDAPPRGAASSRLDAGARTRALRVAALLSHHRRRGPRAARAQRGLLHDLQRGSRGQRRARASHAARPIRRSSTIAAARSSSRARGTRAHTTSSVHRRASSSCSSRSPRPRTIPISGGRHKVFGSVRWGIPPQTSTIASHLPKAVGMAVAIDRAARLRARQRSGADGVAHRGARRHRRDRARLDRRVLVRRCVAESLDRAGRDQRRRVGVVPARAGAARCSSARTTASASRCARPTGWVEARMRAMPGVTYVAADGRDLSAAYEATASRGRRRVAPRARPVFLHLRCERVWGHAGSDADGEYRSQRRARARRGSRSGAAHRAVAPRRRRARSRRARSARSSARSTSCARSRAKRQRDRSSRRAPR